MLFHGIKPSVYRQLLNATEAFSPMRQNYLKHVKFCRDVIVSLFLHLPSVPYGKLRWGGAHLKHPASNLREPFVRLVKTLLLHHLGIISAGIHDICSLFILVGYDLKCQNVLC